MPSSVPVARPRRSTRTTAATTATTATRTTTTKTKKTRNHVGHDMPCTVALWAGRLQDVAKVDKYENDSFLTGTVGIIFGGLGQEIAWSLSSKMGSWPSKIRVQRDLSLIQTWKLRNDVLYSMVDAGVPCNIGDWTKLNGDPVHISIDGPLQNARNQPRSGCNDEHLWFCQRITDSIGPTGEFQAFGHGKISMGKWCKRKTQMGSERNHPMVGLSNKTMGILWGRIGILEGYRRI